VSFDSIKQCAECGEVKDTGQFYKDKIRKGGFARLCKDCDKKLSKERNKSEVRKEYMKVYRKNKPKPTKEQNKESYLRSVYGISLETYNNMWERQEGCCAICRKHQTRFKKALAVDHNHATGGVRGLLCSACNTALGLMQDDKDRLRKAAEYLEVFGE